MDGLGLKFARNPLENTFDFDEFGALIPKPEMLRAREVGNRVQRQLKADTGLYRRLTDIYYKTDVEFTDNPYGNTPTTGAGALRYGKRPLQLTDRDRLKRLQARTRAIDNALAKRERKIVSDQESYMALHESLEPADKHSSEYVQWCVEKDQVMTGGGLDGNSIGEVQKSALKFVDKATNHPDFGGNRFSQLVVQGALLLRDKLVAEGLQLGSLTPMGISKVRLEQDKDGMVGYPVYAKGFKELDKDIAVRLLIESGVDSRGLVGSPIKYETEKEPHKANVVDALGMILDNTTIDDPSQLASIVTLLARIQKHAWVLKDGKLEPKKPKTRSVYPNAALPGAIEAMTMTPYIDALKALRFSFMPSLQNKSVRVQIIKSLIQAGHAAGYEFLPLDESQYDATVIGGAFATIMYYAIRPFFNSKYYDWVDFCIYCLCYKYLLTDTALDSINAEEFETAKKSAPWVEAGPFTIFALIDGLISGAKLTHVGGSLYGGSVIHYAIPILLGYKPFLGVQAGDDCLFAIPKERIVYGSAEQTYGPVEEVAKQVGIDINKLKQIWYVVDNEVVNIFLQDTYHEASGTWGIGSSFRPLSAVFFSERNKGLSIAEQFMAEISRMNQGYDSAFIKPVVEKWLSMEQFIGALYKEYGESAFKKITESTGLTLEELAQRIDVGSFSFGMDREDLVQGKVPINPIIAEVAANMQFTKSAAQVLKAIGVTESNEQMDTSDLVETPDIGDSDDIRAA